MRARRGFTLIEALASVFILSVVMAVALTLLVSMRSFAAKQQAFTAPRQTARRAIDYLSFFAAGATDLNLEGRNPNALLMEFGFGASGALTTWASSYNNLDGADVTNEFGDAGTDILSFSIPVNPVRIAVARWDNPRLPASNTLIANFVGGCPDDVENLRLFKLQTGMQTVDGVDVMPVLTVQDALGRWRYIRITSYGASVCANTGNKAALDEVIPVQYASGATVTGQFLAPGGFRLDLEPLPPYTINAGIEYTSFRVRNRTLEQKTTGFDEDGVYSPGFFDPRCDGKVHAAGAVCPAIGFTPIVENVEDFQVAYVYDDGTVVNNVLPTQAQFPVIPTPILPPGEVWPPLRDVVRVSALRISIVGRSNPLDIGARNLSAWDGSALYLRPAVEDRPAGASDTVATGVFDRYRLTTTLVLRNRMLGY
jgi:prepilin-type N-terminal cleavage/methylation domain-containing protein